MRKPRAKLLAHQQKKARQKIKGHHSHCSKNNEAIDGRRWVAPREISLTKTMRTSSLAYINRLRMSFASAHKNKTCLHLDFSKLKKINADGMLLLCAEYDRLARHFQGVTTTYTLPNSSREKEVFDRVGMLIRLGCTLSFPSNREDVKHWRHTRGHDADANKFDAILKPYEDILPEKIDAGMAEAMCNSTRHAYLGIRSDGLNLDDSRHPSWWAFSQHKDGQLTLFICDLGIGIPQSMRVSHAKFLKASYDRDVIRLRKILGDADLIEAATRLGITSKYKYANEGKGLASILQGITSIRGSTLMILSNHGGLWVDKNGRKTMLDFKDSVHGTLLAWTIPVENLPGSQKQP